MAGKLQVTESKIWTWLTQKMPGHYSILGWEVSNMYGITKQFIKLLSKFCQIIFFFAFGASWDLIKKGYKNVKNLFPYSLFI